MSNQIDRSNKTHVQPLIRPHGVAGATLASGLAVRPCIAALGAFALAQVFADEVLAQGCNSNPNPSPPNVTLPDVNGKTFGPSPNNTFGFDLRGVAGCDGAAGDNNSQGSGHPGSPGQPAASAALDVENVTTIGVSNTYVLDANVGAPILATGGFGGVGGATIYFSLPDTTGGAGGAGGAGGSLTGSITGLNVVKSTGEGMTIGLDVDASGGDGNDGGQAVISLYPIEGGIGGAGGAGGTINLTTDFTITPAGDGSVPDVGAAFVADGGNGRNGGGTVDNSAPSTWGNNGGTSGAGGSVTVTTSAATVIHADSTGMLVSASSSQAGIGGVAGSTGGEANPGVGGAGGTGGQANLTFDGQIFVTAPDEMPVPVQGLVVAANGGDGGDGGPDSSGLGGIAGSGGNGGDGGTVEATVLGNLEVNGLTDVTAPGAQGVLLQANGGAGGMGKDSATTWGSGGDGGKAGSGQKVTLQLGSATAAAPATINMTGTYGQGAVAQSIGGGGGDAGSAQFFGGGGIAANGGNGGEVDINPGQVEIITEGDSSRALIAQSIGGGGGFGGNSTDAAAGAQLAVGGNSGSGGSGAAVNVALGQKDVVASMSQKGGGGVLAQSIGGTGGVAGNASVEGGGVLAMAVGGTAGNGGNGGGVAVTNPALVTTWGDHAVGLKGQSIGGGGGIGGTAYTLIANAVLPTAAVSVGGSGGEGGSGGAVTVANSGQLTTYGPDAHGISAQSVGGGGGAGGSATATSIDVAPDPDIPAISVSFTAGGAGGVGNTGGAVGVSNAATGIITTAGHGAMGIKAQSVGGGGGDAGDATAASWSGSRTTDSAISIDLSVALGGAGGKGGNGGTVTGTNDGLVYTTGQDAYGLFAHSVGGGGGTGGVGDTSATSVMNDASIGVSVSLGGGGGTGGHGGNVTVTNAADGVIGTSGDSSDGVFAQSVGGGGGVAGGGTAATSAGELSVSVAVGGGGGAGGNGGTVTAENDGLIATVGTDSLGLAAQSVGGGGGRGGKAGATAGGADDNLPQFVFGQVTNGFGAPNMVTKIVTESGNDLFQFDNRLKGDITSIEKLQQRFVGQADPAKEPEGFSTSLDLGVGVGGSGGAAGEGGDVTLTNTGQISTQGAQADGVLGQSVGGGGGIGGASGASGASSDDTNIDLSVSLGGSGGAAGNGGAVAITHSGGLATEGVSAYGIVGQSVGGGGGRGAASGDGNGSALSFGVSVGGGGGATGDGGTVDITTSGTVSTTGKHAVGVLAQSVGGGGGLARTMTTQQQGDQSQADDSDEPDTHNIFLDVGVSGVSGAEGDGGEVTVRLNQGTSITTTGRNGHGVVATSIGGGGSAVGGGVVNLIQRALAAGPPSGNAQTVEIVLQNASVDVSGTNSVGVWGASIGGGGNVLLTDATANVASGETDDQTGSASNVSVNLVDSTVSATGGGPAIIAHSIAGGGISPADGGGVGPEGKWVSVDTGLSNYGPGIAGDAIVTLSSGSSVTAADSSGIVVATTADVEKGNDGASRANAVVVVSNSTVTNASADRAAIMFLSNSTQNPVPHILENYGGTITNTAAGGYAVYDGSNNTPITITNQGTITGNIDAGTTATTAVSSAATPAAAVGSMVRNWAKGLLAPYDTLDLGEAGALANAGTIEVSGVRRFGRTRLTGDLVQSETGRLRFDLDAAAGKVDRLHVTGAATLDGGFEVVPRTLMPRRFEVLDADRGLTLADSFAGVGTHLFAFRHDATDTTLAITPVADFSAEGSEGDRSDLARHLQSIWDNGGTGFASGLAALAGVEDADDYAAALDSMSPGSVAAVGYARYLSSQWMARAGYSCPAFDAASVVRTERSCSWLQVRGSALERDADGSDPGFDFDSVITAVGGQAEVGEGLFIGGAIGWENSDLSDDTNNTSIDGDALLAAATVKHEAGPWTLSGAIDLGYGSFDSSRNIAVGAAQETADGSSNAMNAGLHFRAAYEMPRDGWYAEPAIDVDLNYVQLDDYTETGAGDFDLDVDSSNTTVLTGTPWIKVGRRVDLSGGGTLNAYTAAGVSLSAGEDFDTTARFASAPAGTGDFTTTLDNPNVVGRISAGVEVFATDRIQIRLQYDGSFADNQTENAGQIRFAYFF